MTLGKKNNNTVASTPVRLTQVNTDVVGSVCVNLCGLSDIGKACFAWPGRFLEPQVLHTGFHSQPNGQQMVEADFTTEIVTRKSKGLSF